MSSSARHHCSCWRQTDGGQNTSSYFILYTAGTRAKRPVADTGTNDVRTCSGRLNRYISCKYCAFVRYCYSIRLYIFYCYYNYIYYNYYTLKKCKHLFFYRLSRRGTGGITDHDVIVLSFCGAGINTVTRKSGSRRDRVPRGRRVTVAWSARDNLSRRRHGRFLPNARRGSYSLGRGGSRAQLWEGGAKPHMIL